MGATAQGEIEIVLKMSESAMNAQIMAAQESRAKSHTDSIAAHERQVSAMLELDIQRLKASGRDSEIKHIENVLNYKKKVAEYEKLGFTPAQAASMTMQGQRYAEKIAEKIAEKNAEKEALAIKERQAAIDEKSASRAAEKAQAQAKNLAEIKRELDMKAAIAAGDENRVKHLRAMASLERNVQLGLNAGMKPSEALQHARTMLRLEQSISQEKQKQQTIIRGQSGLEYAGVRRGSAFSGGQNAAYRVGMISQQAQDVAISMQMGMSASRVIAQQGSQIASIFGQKGMVIGGVIAIGAAIAEWALNTKAAEAAAEKYKKTLDDVAKIRKDTQKTIGENQVSRTRLAAGDYAADEEAAAMKLAIKNKELNDKQKEINEAFNNAPQSTPEERRKAAYDRNKGTLAVDRAKQTIAEEANLEKIAREKKMNDDANAYAAAANFEAELAQEKASFSSKASQREAENFADEYQFKKELADIDKSGLSEANKQIKRNALENKYNAEGAAKDRQREIDDQAEIAKGALEGAEIQRKSNEDKLDIEKKAMDIRAKEAEYGKQQTETQRRLLEYERQRYEISQKRRYGLITEAQAAAELHAVNQQQATDMISRGMGPEAIANARGRAERKAAEAAEKARKKSEDNLGLTGVHRGIGGEIISGIDPSTGKRISGEELNRRRQIIAEARQPRADAALSMISPESIGQLTAAIEKLLAK